MKIYYIALFIAFFSCRKETTTAHRYQGKVDADIIRVSARTAGVIDSIFVDEGDRVNRGTPMARISVRRTEAKLMADRARLAEIEANRQALSAQEEQLRINMDLARKTYDKMAVLFKQGAVTEQKYDEAHTKYQSLKAQWNVLQAQENVLLNKRKAVQAALNVSRINKDDAHITAPTTAVVLTRLHSPGEWAAPGMPLFEISNLDQVDVICYIPQKELARTHIGDSADVFVDGSDTPLKGRVIYIADRSEFTPKTILTEETRTTLVYRIKIRVQNREGILKLGMPVDVETGA